jgi:hypothetical protein
MDETPPELRMFELTFDGLVSARLCYVAAKLQLADLMGDSVRSSEELAAATGMDPRSLYRILRALGEIGVVVEHPDRQFALTPVGATLRTAVPGSMRAWAEFSGSAHYLDAWSNLLHTVESGRPAFDEVHGTSFFDYLAEHPDHSRVFDDAMTSLTEGEAPAITAAYDFSSFRRIVDVGGGRGSLLVEILRTHAGPTGIIFDQPHVTPGVAERLAELGLSDRCEVVSGDFFAEVPAGDAILLKFILHDWDDDACGRILASCRRAIDPNGKLLALEAIVPPAGIPGHSRLDDVEMMILLGSQERTEEEYAALFSRSGFRLVHVSPASYVNVLEAIPV